MAKHEWNAIMWILDTLSEGTYSFTELDDYIGSIYGRNVIRESLELLVSQDLICVLEGAAHGDYFPKMDGDERSKRVERFFEIADTDRRIALTEAGQSLLRLVGIGHP